MKTNPLIGDNPTHESVIQMFHMFFYQQKPLYEFQCNEYTTVVIELWKLLGLIKYEYVYKHPNDTFIDKINVILTDEGKALLDFPEL